MAQGIDTVGPVGSLGSMDDRGSGRRNKQGSAGKPADSTASRTDEPASDPHAAPPPNLDELQPAVEQINEHLARLNRALELRADPRSGRTIVMIKDTQTAEILQQIPAEDSAQLAQLLSAWSDGGNVLLDLIA